PPSRCNAAAFDSKAIANPECPDNLKSREPSIYHGAATDRTLVPSAAATDNAPQQNLRSMR
ncbi:hypothetical protein QN387_26165, partial [Pseudomonas sp. CCI3.1]